MIHFFDVHYFWYTDIFTGKKYMLVIQQSNFFIVDCETNKKVNLPFFTTRENIRIKFKNGYETDMKPNQMFFEINDGFTPIAKKLPNQIDFVKI